MQTVRCWGFSCTGSTEPFQSSFSPTAVRWVQVVVGKKNHSGGFKKCFTAAPAHPERSAAVHSRPLPGAGEAGIHGSAQPAWEIRTAAGGSWRRTPSCCWRHVCPAPRRNRGSGRGEAESQSTAWGLAFPSVGDGAALVQKAGLALRACRSFPATLGALDRTSRDCCVARVLLS